MPELPEIETTLRGIQSFITHQKIQKIVVRNPNLRWPIPDDLSERMKNKTILTVSRRGKYLLLETTGGNLILHLGMSGSLRILTQPISPEKHDHVDIMFTNKIILRFNDPRRFGALLLTANPLEHPLLRELGPEPLTEHFSGKYLWLKAQRRRVPIKSFIMNNKIVVGVGNIYATEALFYASIHPEQPANTISKSEFAILARSIKMILRKAIKQGGTTLRNFVDSHGKPGYFSLHLKVYGRNGLPCTRCKTTLQEIRLNQRSSVYCPKCQALS